MGVFSSCEIVAINSFLLASCILSLSIISINGFVIRSENTYAHIIDKVIATLKVIGISANITFAASSIGWSGILTSKKYGVSLFFKFNIIDCL